MRRIRLTHELIVNVAIGLVGIETWPVEEQQVGGMVAHFEGAVCDRAQHVLLFMVKTGLDELTDDDRLITRENTHLDEIALQAEETLEQLSIVGYSRRKQKASVACRYSKKAIDDIYLYRRRIEGRAS
jgi:hypothetical protein